MREFATVLYSDGTVKSYRPHEGESTDEFSGRLWCAIEERITGKRGPTIEGTRVVVWRHQGHYVAGMTGPFGGLYTSTGNPYADRWRMEPGIYSLEQAREKVS